MIQESVNDKNHILLTSDHWHVLRARWTGKASGTPLYVRTIISEHDDKASAVKAGHELVSSFQAEMNGRAPDTRDKALVRRPGYRSLKISKTADGHSS
jgi:hypothetical protein